MEIRPSLKDIPAVRVKPAKGVDDDFRYILDAHSPVNAVQEAVRCLDLAAAALPGPAKTAGDYPFPTIRARLRGMLDALSVGRENFKRAAADKSASRAALREIVGSGAMDHPPAKRWAMTFQKIELIIGARVAELLERWTKGHVVGTFSQDEVRAMLQGVLGVISEVSQSGAEPFGVSFDPDHRGPDDYLVRFSMTGPDGGDKVTMPEILRDVVRDLTCNARKYSAPGSEISVRVDEDDDGVSLEVEDQGIGISLLDFRRIGEAGYRGAAASRLKSGHGFGLAKACVVAEVWGGTVEFRSLPDVGAIFCVRIPKPYKAKSAPSDALIPVAK